MTSTTMFDDPGAEYSHSTRRGIALGLAVLIGAVFAAESFATWEAIGPAPIVNATMAGSNTTFSGRTTSIVIDPIDPDILLLGVAQGGIWRSTDGGSSFTPVADNMPSMAIKVIRFAPSDPTIVYAGSGEPHSKTSIFGMGVYKSTDAGVTWTALPNTGALWDFRYLSISGLQVNPTNADELVVTVANADGSNPEPLAG
ncbi:WD40/YVTN/BNR-like repeat-containing protein, partial [Verrucomicrobiota bacterium]